MSTAPAPDRIRERIERLYRTATGAESGRGSQRWFARLAGVDHSTVYRWVSGRMEPSPTVVALIKSLEREAGLRNGGPFD